MSEDDLALYPYASPCARLSDAPLGVKVARRSRLSHRGGHGTARTEQGRVTLTCGNAAWDGGTGKPSTCPAAPWKCVRWPWLAEVESRPVSIASPAEWSTWIAAVHIVERLEPGLRPVIPHTDQAVLVRTGVLDAVEFEIE